MAIGCRDQAPVRPTLGRPTVHRLKITNRFEKRIYIPLPGPEARKRMFELNVGTTPCTLTPQEYRGLAEKTEGCAFPNRVLRSELIFRITATRDRT